MVTVHAEPLEVVYRANRLSCTTCCALFYWVVLLIVPYVLAYVTGGLWAREVLGRERPAVRFTHEALMEAYGRSSVSASASLVRMGWSTSAEINAALGADWRPSDLRAWSEDADRDGRPETLQFVLRVPLASGEQIHSISLMLGFGAVYDSATALRINSSVAVTHSSPMPGLRSSQSAELLLHSERSLRGAGQPARAPCTEPFYALQTPLQASGAPVTIESVSSRYRRICNDTVRLTVEPPLWTPGASDAYEMHLTVHVPEQPLVVQPRLLEALKKAFVDYLALFIPLHALLLLLKGTLLKHGLVAARMHHPIKQHRF